MSFELFPIPPGLLPDARFDETLIDLAAQNGPSACVWESEQGLVVPRTYQRYDNFAASCARFAQEGWPVTVRQSGGGIVPQATGIINLSLAYAVQGKPLDQSDAAYLLICRIIAQALDEYGVSSHPQAVEGSFCDGRYNLAVGDGASARKVAGTAQLWRRHPGTHTQDAMQIVLVHALILAAVDVAAVTTQTNRFEAALGSGKQYASERLASVYELSLAHSQGQTKPAFTQALKTSLEAQLRQP
ncbi:lipoate--protein ligase family protein [Alcaligenaceae bacterium]|nr:lipoate--protein ligase family protein [Alcaligenaceae bacterium]